MTYSVFFFFSDFFEHFRLKYLGRGGLNVVLRKFYPKGSGMVLYQLHVGK